MTAGLPPLPAPWSITELCRRLSARRGRPLLVHSLDLPALPSGLWYDDGKVDHIICRGGIVGYHHDHVILHEICHMLACHNSGSPARNGDEVGGLLDCAAERDHTGYQEELAETFASMVLRRVNLRPAPVSEFERRAAAMFGAI